MRTRFRAAVSRLFTTFGLISAFRLIIISCKHSGKNPIAKSVSCWRRGEFKIEGGLRTREHGTDIDIFFNTHIVVACDCVVMMDEPLCRRCIRQKTYVFRNFSLGRPNNRFFKLHRAVVRVSSSCRQRQTVPRNLRFSRSSRA